DLYTEYIKERIKEIPLEKALVFGSGQKRLIVFVNPDCGHCRREWSELKKHFKSLKLYIFLLPFESSPENVAKANYIACSKNKLRAFDLVLSGSFDKNPPKPSDCPLVKEHISIAEKLGVQSVPYNIILDPPKVIEGHSPALFEHLGLK
ncbi:MAG: thioredoxin fold domain-containing protein, partial [Aquificaceae bacterium]|nr:thioredoxin fold domain-containing protein [Aquificaceae bacterium]